MEKDWSAACAAYFRNTPGFERTMELLRKKWYSYGRTAGEICLADPSVREIQALEGYFGRSVLKRGKLRFQTREFEQALDHTRFRGAALKGVLEEYFGEPLLSRKEEEAALQARKDRLFQRAQEKLQEALETYGKDHTECSRTSGAPMQWLEGLTAQKIWQLCPEPEGEDSCLAMVCQTGLALARLEKLDSARGIRLAVLAMECTGNPHGFDRGTPGGNLLLGALPVLFGEEDGRVEISPRLAAEDALDRYIRCGIRPDDLSSFTILYRILLKDENGLVPAYKAMADRREPMLVSLLNLRNIRAAMPVHARVYVLENQMVFSQLCESCPESSLICTSGQVRTASLMVLDLLCREDVEIYYSGDLDPEGIGIADRLISRSGGKIRPWHMSAKDYGRSVSSVDLSEERLRELDHIKSPCLEEAAEAVRSGKKAAYQERLLEQMEMELGGHSS